jgi:hypothetical protein
MGGIGRLPAGPLNPAELRRRELAREVFPYVKKSTTAWFDPHTCDSFHRPNCCHRHGIG